MERSKPRLLFPPLSLHDRSLVQTSRRESLASTRLKNSGRAAHNRSDGFVPKRSSVTPAKARPIVTPVRDRPQHTRFLSSIDLSTPPKPPVCPWKLTDITFTRCVGKGSLGRIMLGQVAGKEVAVKVIEKVSTKVRRVAEAERAVLEKLKHALMVTYFGCIEEEGAVNLVMEFLPKGDLFHLMKRHRLKPKDVKFYAAEAVCGLKYLHDQRIVYRDLKPENLMLDSNGHLKFIDFGFAKQLVADRTNSVLGSPEYMAPELVMKRPHGLPVDCWSFGILLYELWCHHPPFQGTSPREVYERIIEGEYEIPGNVETSAKDLIRKLLNPEARFRPTVEGIMTHPYFQEISWALVDRLSIEAPTFTNLPERAVEEFQTDLFDS